MYRMQYLKMLYLLNVELLWFLVEVGSELCGRTLTIHSDLIRLQLEDLLFKELLLNVTL